jgi:hypothetical protein
MKKKIVLAAALVLILVPLSLGAQTAGATGNAEFQFLSFDIGYAPGWQLGGGGVFTTPALFGLNVKIANSFTVGYQNLTAGAVIDNFLLLKYNFTSQLRAVVGFGVQDATGTPAPASSLGIEVVPFSRSVGGLAATEFKIALKYDSPFANMTNGKILFALAFGIGF